MNNDKSEFMRGQLFCKQIFCIFRKFDSDLFFLKWKCELNLFNAPYSQKLSVQIS